MKFLETIRVIVISPEFLLLLSSVAIYIHWPAPFIDIGNQFKNNNEIWKFILTLPLAICGFSIQYAWKILFPKESGSNNSLLNWPNYWKLKLRVFVSVILCAICIFSAIFILIYSSVLTEKIVGTIFITAVTISTTVAFNQFLAAFKIRELLEIKR
jgi:hypothetical protein